MAAIQGPGAAKFKFQKGRGSDASSPVVLHGGAPPPARKFAARRRGHFRRRGVAATGSSKQKAIRLDCPVLTAKMRAVNFRKWIAATVILSAGGSLWAVEPFKSATVTRLENQVSIGAVHGGQVQHQKPASLNDVVRSEDYLKTETSSRAELQFPDKSIVRVGQNAVFSFDASSRTLSLQKGAMLFYVPPGNGGYIKTPALTAAITGTIAKVLANPDRIAVVSGSLTTDLDPPCNVIYAGEVLWIENGKPRKDTFPPSEATAGILYGWGPFPELPETHSIYDPPNEIPAQIKWDEILNAVLNPNTAGKKKSVGKSKDEDSNDESSSEPEPMS